MRKLLVLIISCFATLNSPWSQSLLKCPALHLAAGFAVTCEQSPTQLGKLLSLTISDTDSSLGRLVYSGPTVPGELALVAFRILRNANSDDIAKLCAAAPELAQTYIYALRAARDDEVDALLEKAAATKLWGNAHRGSYNATHANMQLLPDDFFRRTLAAKAKLEGPSELTNTQDLDALRLNLAFTLALDVYNGARDLANECSVDEIERQPRRLAWCRTLAKRLLANAETTLELHSALEILKSTANGVILKQHLTERLKAWEDIDDAVRASLGGVSSQPRKAFMHSMLARREPEVLLEKFAALPGANLAWLEIVNAPL